MTFLRGCPQQVVRVMLVDFGERHRHTDKRAALHRNIPPADQSGKRVEAGRGSRHARHARLVADTGVSARILARISRGCHAVNGERSQDLCRIVATTSVSEYSPPRSSNSEWTIVRRRAARLRDAGRRRRCCRRRRTLQGPSYRL